MKKKVELRPMINPLVYNLKYTEIKRIKVAKYVSKNSVHLPGC